ncbi:ABC transporter substrate-binding protein [Alkalibacter mobilis]|uniref:ABC transporter substrate-binding protein n=1 Tax=Alkalibacter mobilis TaxID=2787712 RepID=UPI00189F8870|nr:ABC transporter substrate-binding protein [Alkalibacter mobilis]MBF7097866.1 ABC transporter substrate-binding protein [Alkalibacter mobilis]
MNIRKVSEIRIVCLILVVLFVFAGCTAASGESSDGNDSNNDEESGTRVVTDIFGRSVVIPSEVKTVAAVGGAARILTYVGCADKLVGVTDMDKQNVSAMPYSVINAEHFKNLASVEVEVPMMFHIWKS